MKKALLISHHNVFDSGFVSTILYDCNCIIHIVDQKYLKNIKKNDLLKFDIVFIFGGKASANSNSKSITYELKFLKKIIKLNLNVIGFCLGAQLIAKLYGSKITNFKNNNTEIGYKKILNPNKKYFSRRLNNLVKEIAIKEKINLYSGNYCWTLGPAYETPSEIEYFERLGGSAVGMSTFPEVVEAGRLNLRILTKKLFL